MDSDGVSADWLIDSTACHAGFYSFVSSLSTPAEIQRPDLNCTFESTLHQN
jgi:hypothetical protein